MTDMDKMMIEPIPMLLYCPQCGQQHVDEPDERTPDWTNPPHRSHLCHDCGCIWRPADVPTNGVAAIETQGKADTWTAARGNAESVTAYNPDDRLREVLEGFLAWSDRVQDWENGANYLNGEKPPHGNGDNAWDDLDKLRDQARSALSPLPQGDG